jgi:hypothetical protein
MFGEAENNDGEKHARWRRNRELGIVVSSDDVAEPANSRQRQGRQHRTVGRPADDSTTTIREHRVERQAIAVREARRRDARLYNGFRMVAFGVDDGQSRVSGDWTRRAKGVDSRNTSGAEPRSWRTGMTPVSDSSRHD